MRHQNNVQTRLKKLCDRGYIGRRFLPIRRKVDPDTEFFDFGGQRNHGGVIYYLRHRGAEYLHFKYRIPEHRLRRYTNHHEVKLFFLSHTLDLSDVHACFDLAVEGHPEVELGRWINEKDKDDGDYILRMPVEVRDPEDGTKRRCSLWPDAAFLVRHKTTGAERLLFLEIDEGHELVDRKIRDKILGYRTYLESGAAEEMFEFEGEGFSVVMVTRGLRQEGRKRMRNLMRRAEDLGMEDVFCFTTFSALMPEDVATGDVVLAEPIWHSREGEDAFSLMDRLFGS